MQIKPEQNTAASSIAELVANKIGSNRAVHPATAISACARLAGSFMMRSFNFKLDDITPGTVMLSEEANQKGPNLINVLGGMLSSMGVVPNSNKLNTASNAQANLSFLESMQLLQNDAFSIMKQNSLTEEEMAYSCAMATAFIIKECKNDLEVETGFHTAVYCFIEGSKTCPPKLDVAEKKKKGLFGFWK
jgi:hypothetical protein